MNQAEPTIDVGTPLYLVTSTEACWKCHRPQSVIALATRSLRDGDMDTLGESTDEDEPFLLSNITEMPEAIFQHLSGLNLRYCKHFSHTAGRAYYTNTCGCGANFGDFYLHSEPEGAFFPMTEEQAAGITVSELPFQGVFPFRCSWSQGTGQLIFEHAQRVQPNG